MAGFKRARKSHAKLQRRKEKTNNRNSRKKAQKAQKNRRGKTKRERKTELRYLSCLLFKSVFVLSLGVLASLREIFSTFVSFVIFPYCANQNLQPSETLRLRL